MKTKDIAEALAASIEYKILAQWKHEGQIEQTLCDGVVANIDGKTYVITVVEEEHDNE